MVPPILPLFYKKQEEKKQMQIEKGMKIMGDVNQFQLIQEITNSLEAPFLEVGSKNYGSTQNLRSLLEGKGEYIGIDMAEGDGVDHCLDLTHDFSVIDEKFSGQRFNTVICLSVLEHCDKPFKMAENIERLLKPGGQAVIWVPFAWKFHGYPSDYWRFTHEGVKKLFPTLSFEVSAGVASTSKEGEFLPLDENIGLAYLNSKNHWKKGNYLQGTVAKAMRILGNIKPFSWLSGYRYVLVPTGVFMVGTLNADADQQPIRKAG
ncbi:hypothetical protein MNBD_PLANCTO02-1271 [hydrothermal vent metagenome]|uniref:Uncharacterized protein n=1 Tax=hydrothermal vent metagenome TaxID=652676 RepID=A0A3B1DQK8_9ZZZZ